MTAFDYTAIRAVADQLLTDFGQAVLIRRATNTAGLTPWEPSQATTDYASIGVVTNLTRWYASFAENSDILRTDRLGYVSAGPLVALNIVPTPFDLFVTVTGQILRIIDAKPIAPAGIPVLYVLQLRS